jgi:hypothetical protein
MQPADAQQPSPVRMMIFPTLKVAYGNLPKVASTSLYNWFYERLYGRTYSRTAPKIPRVFHIHGYFGGNHCELAYRERDPALVRKLDGYFVFAVTRDPVQRFLSMYGNRVLHHNELSRKHLKQAVGLRPRPGINFLVRHMERYFLVANNVRHHSRPMVDFLGKDMTVYQRLFDISELDTLMAQLNAHIDATGFRSPGRLPALPHLENKGRKLGFEALTPRSFEKLVEFFKEDYALIPSVDVVRTRQSFQEARAAARAEGRRLPDEPKPSNKAA